MRTVNAAAQALRERGEIKEVPLIWIRCVDRETGEVKPVGIWGGVEAEDIQVADLVTGEQRTRTFYPGLSGVDDVVHEMGIVIRATSVQFSPLDAAVQIAFREREPRGVQVQIWKRAYDRETQRPVAGLPEAWLSGYINEAPLTMQAGEATLSADIVSTARMLTITSARRKSDEAQRRRGGDRARRYKATAGDVDLPWAQADNDE